MPSLQKGACPALTCSPSLADATPCLQSQGRDKHPDAQKGKGHSMGGSGGNFVLRRARVVNQPGDGSCLFHSMSYGLGSGSASSLRSGCLRLLLSVPVVLRCLVPAERTDGLCSAWAFSSVLFIRLLFPCCTPPWPPARPSLVSADEKSDASSNEIRIS